MSNSLTNQFLKINELLKGAKRVLVASHENPDPDAVGSVLALHHILKKQNFQSYPYLPGRPPRCLNFLPGFYSIKNELGSIDFDLVFCLDYGDFKRLRLPDFLSEESIITIDHHLKSDHRGQIKIVEPGLSSTSEIIYLWMEASGVEIDKDIAVSLLAGIFSDTGGFSHVTTSSKTLKIVSQLLLGGAPLTKIARSTITLGKPLNSTKIWGRALSRIKTDKGTGLAYSWASLKDFEECGAQTADLAGISSVISTISQANLALFLTEQEPGKIEGSLRSEPYKREGKNVAQLAEALGGGGHPYAAGFRQEGTIETVLKKVLNLIE